MRARSCRTVSRFLYPCGWQSFLWAGHYWPALATYPEVERDGPSLLPYLVLLRVGFSLPAELLPPRCALTAPFHPYPAFAREAVYFLWHFPSSLAARPAVSRHVALWRPDFPPPVIPGGDCPSGSFTDPIVAFPCRLCARITANRVLTPSNSCRYRQIRCILYPSVF